MVAHGEDFVLGGWSMGGVVAVEMAQQLRAAGRPANLVAESQACRAQRRVLKICGFEAREKIGRIVLDFQTPQYQCIPPKTPKPP